MKRRCIVKGFLPILALCLMVILLVSGYAMAAGNPSAAAEAAWRKGFDLYRQRRYADAVREFDAALAADPGYARAWNGKGICIAFMGRPQEGLKHIDKALALNPSYENGHFNKALALELSHRWKDAIKSFDDALRIVPGNPWSHYGKACSYGMMGDARGAAESLGKAIAIDPATRVSAKTERDLAKVRHDPAIKALLDGSGGKAKR